MTSAELGFKK